MKRKETTLTRRFLESPGPRERLSVEMDLVAANLIHLTDRYQVLPVGRSSLVIPRPDLKGITEEQEKDFPLILGEGRHSKLPYKAKLAGHQLMRTRLRTPGLTPATKPLVDEMSAEAPWAWQSGISLASNQMVTWALMQRLKGQEVRYNAPHDELSDGFHAAPFFSFTGGTLGAQCWPTEQYFVREVCAYLSPWWIAETEVDGELRGEEVRIDAVLTLREDPRRRVGVEFKHPHTVGASPLKGLRQASAYRRAAWERHGRLPIAYCHPGQVPTGKEASFVKRKMGIGILDIVDYWVLDMPDYNWKEEDQS